MVRARRSGLRIGSTLEAVLRCLSGWTVRPMRYNVEHVMRGAVSASIAQTDIRRVPATASTMAPPIPPLPPPSPSSPHGVTELLLAWNAGDRAALDALLPVVYAELRRQAERAMQREGAGHTLQPTALVHEVYLRLVDQERVHWRNRAQFFGVAAQLMRRILVDHARSRQAAKRGGGAHQITLTRADAAGAMSAEDSTDDPVVEVLALHDALTRLAEMDPDQGRLVELRYFGGLSIQETAAVLGVSPATVKREWNVARAWLRREIGAR